MATDENPQFSVIIPTHNRPRLLCRCVESVLAQTLPADTFEIIVVDDGSRRSTAWVLQSYIKAGKVCVLRQRQQGWAIARQLGARHSRGEFLVFLDDDCCAPLDWLMRYAQVYTSHPEADGIGGSLCPGSKVNVAGRKQYRGHLAYFCTLNAPLHADPTSFGRVWFTFGGNRSFRRDVWWKAQPETTYWYFDDYVIDLRLRDLGACVYYAPEVWVTHHYALSVVQRVQAAYRYGRSEVGGVLPIPHPEVSLGVAARWRRMVTECPTASLPTLIWYALTQPLAWAARRAGQAVSQWRRFHVDQ